MPVRAASAPAETRRAPEADRHLSRSRPGGRSPWESDLTRRRAVWLIGSETEGIPEEVLERADEVVRIPTRGFIPSYNVQAAAGMVLGEWLRQTDAGRLAER